MPSLLPRDNGYETDSSSSDESDILPLISKCYQYDDDDSSVDSTMSLTNDTCILDTTTRWIQELSSPETPQISLLANLPIHPPGSLLHKNMRPPSPRDIRDFSLVQQPEPTDDSTLFATHDILDSTIENVPLENVVRIMTRSRVLGINDGARIQKYTTSGLIDGGANISICKDESILVDVRPIAPFHIGLALQDHNGKDIQI